MMLRAVFNGKLNMRQTHKIIFLTMKTILCFRHGDQ